MSTTFIATHARRVNAAKLSQLAALVRNTRFSISRGTPERNQPALTLCFDGPREHADPLVIERFKAICA